MDTGAFARLVRVLSERTCCWRWLGQACCCGMSPSRSIHCWPELAHNYEGLQVSVVQRNSHTVMRLDCIPPPLLACRTGKVERGGLSRGRWRLVEARGGVRNSIADNVHQPKRRWVTPSLFPCVHCRLQICGNKCQLLVPAQGLQHMLF